MPPHADSALLGQLSSNSIPYRDPLAIVDWAGLAAESFWMPERALSVYGLPEYETLALEVRQRLSRLEFINVLQAGLWLERVFLQRLSRRLDPGLPAAEYEYFLHELREEAGHSLMFLKAIELSGCAPLESAWRAPRTADFLARRAPVGSVLFWIAMVVGEDIPDKFNRYVRQHSEEVNPAVCQICTLHAIDEARHIAAARNRLEEALGSTPRRRSVSVSLCLNVLLRQFVDVFYYPPARFYELAGLTRGRWWRKRARANAVHRELVEQRLAPTLRLLESYGFRPAF